MIVNPQFFNYRLIIGSLIVTIAVLSVFSYTNYQSIEAHQQFLEQEKKLVESELSQMIDRYDEVSLENDLINTNLEAAKRETRQTLDSLRLLRTDLSVISSFKKQLQSIKAKNKMLFSEIDSLQLVTKTLQSEKLIAYNELEKQRIANTELLEKNISLNKNLEKAAILTANSFKANAYLTVFGKNIETKKANKAESIQVCFSLAENALTEKGEKEIYIQIVNPKNNVMADKGSITFGDSSLIYSLKQIINYNNHALDVCLDVKSDPQDKPLVEGTYFIHVFHKDKKLGSTQVLLN